MFIDMPIDSPSAGCEVRPFTGTLYGDVARKAKVNLPPNATYRKCSVPGERSAVITPPASGGTKVCVFYEFTVDPTLPEVQKPKEKMRTGVAKSLAGGAECPTMEYGARTYPGKDYFFLYDNVLLDNAFALKSAVEKGGLAFIKAERQRPGSSMPDPGATPLRVASIEAAKESDCRANASFFQGRYAACYRTGIYNESLRGGAALLVGLKKKGEYVFIQSTYTRP